MSLASTWFDPVVGIDIHFEMVPSPAGPVPTPFPNPFVGLVFDPVSLAFSIAGPVLINGVPANNTGTEAINKLGVPHIIIPPGTMWTPMPKPPAPTAGKGAPEPGNPAAPDGDAVMIMGSKTVEVMGSNQVRLGDPAMSCGEPVRLPSSAVIAVPKGAPVIVGGPPSLDLMSAALAFLKSKNVAGLAHKLISKVKNARLRNILHKGACFLTGHPVDVATGRVLTSAVDFELPGSLRFALERDYSSGWASRDSVLGHGWSHSLDEAVWVERGRVVYLTPDGRELELDTFDFRDRVMRPGDSVYDDIERITLRARGDFRWEVQTADGVLHELAPVDPRRPERARLVRRSTRDGHFIALTYDTRGDLASVTDSGGRVVRFEHDRHGRLVRVHLPAPDREGSYVHVQYAYDEHGDLVRVTDAYGYVTRFEYVDHLLVKETDRNGLSFHFGYDGVGEDACCVRTWGDGGIYDHVLDYDKAGRVTFVTNSCDETTIYHMDERGLVVKKTDPHGHAWQWKYDDAFRIAEIIDPSGRTTRRTYDDRGNLRRIERADGTTVDVKYDRHNDPVLGVDPLGGKWVWQYDPAGRPLAMIDATGAVSRLGYRDGRLAFTEDADGVRSELEWDRHGNLVRIRGAGGSDARFGYDRQGRMHRIVDPMGGVHVFTLDLIGRPVRTERPGGYVLERRFDPEGQLLEQRDRDQHVRLGYEGYYHLAYREEAGTRVRFHHDTEGRMVAVSNANGERHTFELDACGAPAREVTFDGRVYRFEHDAAGRISSIELPDGSTEAFTYDALGRAVRVELGDGKSVEHTYRADGEISRSANDAVTVEREHDARGRLLRETTEGISVHTRYSAAGRRLSVRSSLGGERVYERDADGLITSIDCGARGRTLEVVRDAGGMVVARKLPGGVIEQRVHDDRRLLVSQRAVVGAGVILDRQLSWSSEARLDAVREAGRGSWKIGYDARGRLNGLKRPDGSVQYRALDPVGNAYEAAGGTDRTYEVGGRLTRVGDVVYTYDARGRLVQKRGADGCTWRYELDDASELVKVIDPHGTTVELRYDTFGRRIGKRVVPAAANEPVRETRWVWDGDHVLHEISGTSTITWHGSGEDLAPFGREQGGEWHSVISDQVDTPVMLVSSAGAVAWRGELDLYGRAALEVEDTECPLRWPGQWADADTGLHYNRFRHYDPEGGGYTTPDPIGLMGGLQPYGYVVNPLVLCDFFGLDGHHTIPVALVETMNDKAGSGFDMPADELDKFKNPDRPGTWPLDGNQGGNYPKGEAPHTQAHKALSDYVKETHGVEMRNGTQWKSCWEKYVKKLGSYDAVMKDLGKFYKKWLPDNASSYKNLGNVLDGLDAFKADKKTLDKFKKKCP